MNTLQTIQQKLKAPKSQYNQFGKYSYRNQEDILEAVKPLLADTKSELLLTDAIVEVGGSLFVESTVILKDSTGSWSVKGYAKHATELKGMQDSQVTGAASSYARKYALNGLFLIDDAKDADSTNTGKKESVKSPEAPTPKTPQTPNPELSWLNPNTENWTHSVKRLKEGMTIADLEKMFKISKANKTKLEEEAKK